MMSHIDKVYETQEMGRALEKHFFSFVGQKRWAQQLYMYMYIYCQQFKIVCVGATIGSIVVAVLLGQQFMAN